jgi:hypothetical protein
MLPSTVGGDGVRIWLFARNSGGWTSATYSGFAAPTITSSASCLGPRRSRSRASMGEARPQRWQGRVSPSSTK